MNASHLLPVCCSLLLLAAPTHAQGAQFTWSLPAGETSRFAPAGDVDGDGFHDFARGVPASASGGPGNVEIFSGADSSPLCRVAGSAAGDRFGEDVASLGNVDGVPGSDLVASAGAGAYLRAFSGATGATIWQVTLPAPLEFTGRIAALGDVDSDGVNDIVAFARSLFPVANNVVAVVSGASGAFPHSVTPSLGGGTALEDLGPTSDRDGDGVDDYFVSVRDSNMIQAGLVTIYSGASGAMIASYQGPGGVSFGESVASLPDVNGDGVDDLVVSSPEEYVDTYARGRVRYVSGADGSVLRTISPPTPYLINFGDRIERFPDFDGDGVDDVIVSRGQLFPVHQGPQPNGLHIYSGATGDFLYTHGFGPFEFLGLVPDANGDGVADYLVELRSAFSGVQSLAVTGWDHPAGVCTGMKPTSQGCSPFITLLGTPSLTIGEDMTLLAGRTISNSSGLFLWSLGRDTRPFLGGQLCLANPIQRFPLVSTTSGGDPCPGSSVPTGQMRFTVSKAQLASLGFLPGDRIIVQGLFSDPGFAPPQDIGLTPELIVTIWP